MRSDESVGPRVKKGGRDPAEAVCDESRRQFALFVTKPARLESYPTRAPLLSYFLSQILQGGKTGGATRHVTHRIKVSGILFEPLTSWSRAHWTGPQPQQALLLQRQFWAAFRVGSSTRWACL